MRKTKLLLATLITPILPFVFKTSAFAQEIDNSSCQYNADGVMTIRSIMCIFENILKIIPGLLLMVATFMVIFAGARMILGGENPKEFETSKNTLLYAIIGIIGLGLVWVILRLIEQFTGANVTQLNF